MTPETRLNHTLPLLLYVATAITGLIDAISYLALGHVFTANMTGNVVFHAFAHGAHCISDRRFDWRPRCYSSFRSLHTELDCDSPKPGIDFVARRNPCCHQFS